ncbi:MAG: Integral membrane protein MviN [Parcubacteria group bacterium Gr01-1014_46]|nr:MAG: Integral membrane protein MviN [Parcubacteria group bacterium Gr01-1014_46]
MGLHEAAYLLGFFAICSQVLALFRDRILASEFGAGNVLDIYYSAFRIPDILFVTVASVVSVSVLIPFLIERFEKGEKEAKEFIDTVFSFFFCLISFMGILAYIFTPNLMAKLFPMFASTDSFPELVKLTRILLLSPVFLGFSNLLASITQINKRFFLYAVSPVFYNVGIIIGIKMLYPIFGLSGLGYGVILGTVLHFLIQVPFIVGQGVFPAFRFPIKLEFIKKIVFTSLPRTITVSANELAELFLISFASFFIAGSISIFNFSFNLQSVPFSIIGISYSLAAFPTLTRLFSNGDRSKFVEQIITSSRHIIFWSVPVSVLFIVLRAQIVRTILGAGRFNWDDTRLTAAALALFTVSLVAQNLVTLFVRSYYSQGKTKTPLLMNVLSAGLIVAGSYYLIHLFQNNSGFKYFIEAILKVPDVPGTIVLMLPLGFSIGLFINLLVHWWGFGLHFPTFSKPVLRTLFQTTGASLIMGFVAYECLSIFDNYLNIDTLMGIFLQGFLSGIIGIISAVIVLYMLKSTELKEVWTTLHHKIWKAKVIPPDAELN